MNNHVLIILFFLLFISNCSTTNDPIKNDIRSNNRSQSKNNTLDMEIIKAKKIDNNLRNNYPVLFGNKLSIISIGIVSDIEDDSIRSGAFDLEMGFNDKVYYSSSLLDCSMVIQQIGVEWQIENNLIPLKVDVSPGRTLLHFYSSELDGYFEILYELYLKSKKAKVSFIFFNKKALSKSATLNDLIDTSEIIKKLQQGLLCKTKSTN